LTDAQAALERFYRRFGAELVQRTDGFFFLLPSGDKLGRRHLSPSEMLVGQGLTLLYLEPATVEQGGLTSRDQLLSQLSASMGIEQLMLAFNAKKKRMDERVAQELVRAKVSEAVRRLASLGFVELLPDERIRLRSSLMRFAEPVRGSGADLEALTRLVASGEVALTGESDDESDVPEGEVAAPDSRPEPPAWNEGTEWGSSFAAPPSTDDLADGRSDLDDSTEEHAHEEASAADEESEVAGLRNAFATSSGEPSATGVADAEDS
jgi:chromosome partition protein MukE